MALNAFAQSAVLHPPVAHDGATVLFCGSCRHEQPQAAGERCGICSRFMVRWDKDHESEYLARKRWRRWYGEPR